mmetsp:Transcript_12589/g.27744  ORF Transcript_12589/g.27744 Transcript_12589/m.27744 type:complete len:209 (+) Transcript_12589:1673-2299(+)
MQMQQQLQQQQQQPRKQQQQSSQTQSQTKLNHTGSVRQLRTVGTLLASPRPIIERSLESARAKPQQSLGQSPDRIATQTIMASTGPALSASVKHLRMESVGHQVGGKMDSARNPSPPTRQLSTNLHGIQSRNSVQAMVPVHVVCSPTVQRRHLGHDSVQHGGSAPTTTAVQRLVSASVNNRNMFDVTQSPGQHSVGLPGMSPLIMTRT